MRSEVVWQPHFFLIYYSKTSERCTNHLKGMKLLKASSWMRGKVTAMILYLSSNRSLIDA